MSGNKKIDIICIISIIAAAIVAVLFINGKKLGIKAEVDEDSENYEGTEYFTANDLNGSVNTDSAVLITLNKDDAKIKGNGAYVLDGDVFITGGGKYLISGELTDGSIIVDAESSSKVWLILDGVTIDGSDDAAIRVEEAEKVFITLADDSINTLTSDDEYSDDATENNRSGVIYARDDLTINGSGTLDITANYKFGIDANDSLHITGGTITVDAASDAIHVNEEFNYTDADLTIDCKDDGIHSDTTVNILGGNILINNCYEGIEALIVNMEDGDVVINTDDDGINANGGSSFAFGNMGGNMPMPGNNEQSDSEGGAQMPQMPDGMEPPDMKDGEMPQLPDGMEPPDMSNGEMPQMPDGMEPPDMKNGERPQMPDGMEPPDMNDGERPHKPDSSDRSDMQDGEKPQKPDEEGSVDTDTTDKSSEEDEDVETYVSISGGSLTIVNSTSRDADGIDSNGDIYISGGVIRISMRGDGNNCALDYGSESGGKLVVTGGDIIACGSSSMAEEFSEESTQCSALIVLDTTASEGQTLTVEDADGNVLMTYEDIPCSFNCVSISNAKLKTGETYTVKAGDTEQEITFDSVTISSGSTGSFGGFGGFRI